MLAPINEGILVLSAKWRDVVEGKVVWRRDSFKCNSLHIGPSSAVVCSLCNLRTGTGTGSTLQLGCIWVLKDDGERLLEFREAIVVCSFCFAFSCQLREAIDCLFVADWDQALSDRFPGRVASELGPRKDETLIPPNIPTWEDLVDLTGNIAHCHSERYTYKLNVKIYTANLFIYLFMYVRMK